MAALRISNRLQRVLSAEWKTCIRLCSTGSKIPTANKHRPYWLKTFPDGKIRSFEEMPGPKPSLDEKGVFRSNIEEYSSDEIDKAHAKWLKEYGYVVKEYFSSDKCGVHVYHPEDMKMVYELDGPYPIRDSHKALADYRRARLHLYNSAGLGGGNGTEWLELRRYVFRGITGSVYMANKEAFNEVSDDLLLKIHSKLDENKEIDITPWLFRWAMESCGILTLNRRLGALREGNDEAEAVAEAAKVTHEMIYRTSVNVGDRAENCRKLAEAQDYFSSVVLKYMDEVPMDADNVCLLNTLRSKNCNWKDINTLILDVFQGAIHNVSFALVYTLLNAAEHKNVQDTARELLRTYEDKGKKYVHSIIIESLRLNPPIIGNGRVTQRDLVLGGYNVPSGTQVILQHAVASRQEENFKDALKFLPERYVVGMLDDSYYPEPSSKYASFIFGHGVRACIGRAFADVQMFHLLLKIIRNYEVSYHHHKIATVNKLHNEPVGPVKLRFEPLPS